MSNNILDKKNDFLYFDEENNIVMITSQALLFDVVKVLSNRDRSNGKKFMQKCLDFCFYINHKDSPLSHLGKLRKLQEVKRFENLKNFDFNNNYYIDFENLFIETHYSRVELRYLKLIKEIDNIIDGLVEIPIKVKKKVKKSFTYGEDNDKVYEIEDVLEYDSTQEKAQAIKSIKDLDILEGILRSKVEKEYKEKRMTTKRLFD